MPKTCTKCKTKKNLHRKHCRVYQLCLDIVNSDFPKEYRLLCHNCNSSKGYYGYCPHEVK